MSKKNIYTVYMHVNKINNKKYIGITRQELEKRWANGLGYKTQPFYKAIEKYGWENFEHYIIYEKISFKKACEFEKELIAQYNTTDYRFGYNRSEGGEDVIIYYNNLVHKNKTVYQYSFDGNFIQSFNSVIEAVQWLNIKNIHAGTNISSCARENGKSHSAYGYIWSYDFLGEQIADYNLHKSYIGNHKIIYQYDLDGNYIDSYYSVKEGAEKYNVTPQSIFDVIDKENRMCANYQWRSYLKKDGIEKYCKNPKNNSYLSKKIVRIDSENNSKIYDSIKDAHKDTVGLDKNFSITRALKGIQKTAYGYRWLYYNDYINYLESQQDSLLLCSNL